MSNSANRPCVCDTRVTLCFHHLGSLPKRKATASQPRKGLFQPPGKQPQETTREGDNGRETAAGSWYGEHTLGTDGDGSPLAQVRRLQAP